MAKCYVYFLSMLMMLVSYEMISAIKASSSENVEKRYKRKADDGISTGRITAKDINAGDISAGSVTADKIKADRIKATNIIAKYISVRRKNTDHDNNPSPPKSPETASKKQLTKGPTTKSSERTTKKHIKKRPTGKSPPKPSSDSSKTNDKNPLPIPTVPPGKTSKDGLLKAKIIESKHIDTNYLKANEITANEIKASVVKTDVVNVKGADKKVVISNNDEGKISKPKTSESVRKIARKENKVSSKKTRTDTKSRKKKKTAGKDQNTRFGRKPVARKPPTKAANKDRQNLSMPPPNFDINIPKNPFVTIYQKKLKKLYLPDMLDDKEDNGIHGIIPNLQFLGLSQDYIKGLQQEQQTPGGGHPNIKRSRPGTDSNKFVNAHSPELKPLLNT